MVRSSVISKALRWMLVCTALLLSLSPCAALAQQSTTALRIRILNARTNQPITDERLNVALAANQIGSVALPTDKSGTIVLDLTRPENRGRITLRILSNMYADCRPRAELYTDYPIATILRTGITTGNLCSNAHPAPTPGQILLYEIPKTFIRTFPNGVNTTLPHSDENQNPPASPTPAPVAPAVPPAPAVNPLNPPN